MVRKAAKAQLPVGMKLAVDGKRTKVSEKSVDLQFTETHGRGENAGGGATFDGWGGEEFERSAVSQASEHVCPEGQECVASGGRWFTVACERYLLP